MTDEGQEQIHSAKIFSVRTSTLSSRRQRRSEELEPLIPAHLANQVRLEKEGIMFAAGPLTKEDGTRYGGMFVLRAEGLIQRSPSDR